MIAAIHQPNYAPWCGYFAKLATADVFILLDDVPRPQGRSYVSRTQVLGPSAPQWLTIPIRHDGQQPICELKSADDHWPRRHLRTLQAMYGKAPFFREVMEWLAPAYETVPLLLTDFNLHLLNEVVAYLKLPTKLQRATALQVSGNGSAHLLRLVESVGAKAYLSGPSGLRYLDQRAFARAGLELKFGRYEPIQYDQGRFTFVPSLSILDALFHCGSAARGLLRYVPMKDAAG